MFIGVITNKYLMENDIDFLSELESLSKEIKPEKITEAKQKDVIEEETLKNDNNIPQSQYDINMQNAFMEVENHLKALSDKLKEQLNDGVNVDQMGDNPFIDAFTKMQNAPLDDFKLEDMNKLFEAMPQINTNEGKEEAQKKMCNEVLECLISSNLLNETVMNMKKTIEESLSKNKDKLNKEELDKYNKSIEFADMIISEANKVHPNKEVIIDMLYQLQQITEIDNII